jgi:ferritin-like metal-binding protein YciE
MEIASYELLERVAKRAGDEETAAVARENRADEEAMAQRIAEHWDLFAEQSLREEGVPIS